MSFRERVLYHQIHPLTIATHLVSGALALVIAWRGSFLLGFLAVALSAGTASALVMFLADLEPYRRSPAGRYLKRYITPPVQVIRIAGYGVMLVAAAAHSVPLMVLGLGTTVLAWFYPFLLPRR